MAAMEIDIPTTDVVTSLPPRDESIFLCSENGEACRHACRAHAHKVHWSNTSFLENDSDVEDEPPIDSISSLVDNYQRRTANLSALTTELLHAAQNDFEDALADAIVDNFMRDHGIEGGLTGVSGRSQETGEEAAAADEDESMDDSPDREDLEAEIINRLLGNCVESSSDEDDDDGDDMFLSPPYVRRQFSGLCAYDSDIPGSSNEDIPGSSNEET